jgi:hypothetical protein
VSLPDAVSVLAGEWNVFGFVLGLMLISAIADRAGFFDALALRAARGGLRSPVAGPESVGHVARYVLDHAPYGVLLLR